jgi:CheY-like chemotaxis protein
MNPKKCIILSKRTAIWPILQSYGYETIVLSESSAFIAILKTVSADLVVIDSDIENGRALLPAIFALSKVPEKITIRDDSTETATIWQERLIHVGSQITDDVWWEIIQKNIVSTDEAGATSVWVKKDKILIIDDVAELVDMYKIMFELKGYEVETAKDGLDGITKAVAFQPKYILLDIMMPHMDGFALMKTFRENTWLKSVIIVNSNIEGPNMSEKIYSAGADYYIRKSDYVPTQLIYMIEQGMFANKRSVSAEHNS